MLTLLANQQFVNQDYFIIILVNLFRQQNQHKHQPLKMRTTLFSEAGRIHQKCKRVKPMNKPQREKMYASCEVVHEPPRSAERKFSPFNTVSRESRDSYLLRVTNQPNTQTNYEVSYEKILKRDRRSTIDQAEFKRIIGPVNENDYSVKFDPARDHRCTAATAESTRPKPLTAREMHNWRKTHEHLSFVKQVNPERNSVHDYLEKMKSTNNSLMMTTLRDTTESNFNNFKRFSLRVHREKSHDFNSDSGHKYLESVFSRDIEPEYDILANKEEMLRKSMKRPKGELRFNLFRNEIKTRVDRSDPNWLQTLDYSPELHQDSPTAKKRATIDFDLLQDRRDNLVHSQYPIRQSLKQHVPMNKVNALK